MSLNEVKVSKVLIFITMIIEFDDHGLIMSQSLEAFASTYGVRLNYQLQEEIRGLTINHLFFVNNNDNEICYECEPCQVLSMLAVTFPESRTAKL